MRQTRVGLADEFLVIAGIVAIVDLGLSSTTTDIDRRTLAERVFVTDGTADVGSIEVFRNVRADFLDTFNLAVDIVKSSRQITVHDRNDRAEMQAIALHTLSGIGGVHNGIFTKQFKTESSISTFEILSHHEGLGETAIVVAAKVNRLSILTNILAVILVAIRIFIGTDHVEIAEFTRDSRSEELMLLED